MLNFSTRTSLLKKLNFLYLHRWHSHLQITPRAIEQLKKIAEFGEHLRINVDSGGCAGFEYKILFDKQINENEDEIIEEDGVKIVVDKVSYNILIFIFGVPLLYPRGTKLVWSPL